MVCGIPDHCHPDARGSDDAGRPVEFLRLFASEAAKRRGTCFTRCGCPRSRQRPSAERRAEMHQGQHGRKLNDRPLLRSSGGPDRWPGYWRRASWRRRWTSAGCSGRSGPMGRARASSKCWSKARGMLSPAAVSNARHGIGSFLSISRGRLTVVTAPRPVEVLREGVARSCVSGFPCRRVRPALVDLVAGPHGRINHHEA